MKPQRLIQRYNAAERINHWIVAACFILLALSGLAFFYPSFFWLTQVFGTPQMARIVHPFVGVIMFLGFARQFFRYVTRNVPDMDDVKWALSVKKVIRGDHMPNVGKYNGGQKVMFWAMTVCLIVLVITGVMMWQPYFANNFSVPARRIAILLHAWSALILIASIIVHVYAAIWVKGTIRAMTEGVVTETWAKKHHPKWHAEVMENHAKASEK
ncbi:formate dehydrogenase subunit gamma [Ignatzschineria sp. RMDPL8A]|uniref:formate dehydrogenase subunit gamma n=1 Tax=Ignatzschineria sp. RMDPL8A TaxID=2999236 RepID=UPI0024467CF0|nr:formate dehydrogenase subunit gamma [Ignatzschineria sp. RMDPL8A]MDG9730115.1 formate dehydrogenase subunit gamma [Ignatzschineria sp. RMDPL8A]